MKVETAVAAMTATLEAERATGRRVGLVPTMGALHPGHAALIRRAADECDVVVVSVFVNPLQFGPTEDFERYPRDLDADVALAAAAGATHLFAPTVAQMYPSPVATTVSVAGLTDTMEGAHRPGHFDGVATVVAKLFAIAGPCRAYFGEKDYQQLLVVRRMAADLSFPVEVVACPTEREPDGLARSSRNAYLSPAERRAAPVLHRALQAAAEAAGAGVSDPAGLRRVMAEVLATEPDVVLDYAEAVDAGSLAVPDGAFPAGSDIRLLVAARLGATRLIDNLAATVAAAGAAPTHPRPTRKAEPACAGA